MDVMARCFLSKRRWSAGMLTKANSEPITTRMNHRRSSDGAPRSRCECRYRGAQGSADNGEEQDAAKEYDVVAIFSEQP